MTPAPHEETQGPALPAREREQQGGAVQDLERLYGNLLALNRALIQADAELIAQAVAGLTAQIETVDAAQRPRISAAEEARARLWVERIFSLQELNRTLVNRALRILAARNNEVAYPPGYDDRGAVKMEPPSAHLHLSA